MDLLPWMLVGFIWQKLTYRNISYNRLLSISKSCWIEVSFELEELNGWNLYKGQNTVIFFSQFPKAPPFLRGRERETESHDILTLACCFKTCFSIYLILRQEELSAVEIYHYKIVIVLFVQFPYTVKDIFHAWMSPWCHKQALKSKKC